MEEEKKESFALSPLTALSPLDGRYRNMAKFLGKFFSEEALINYRVYVEVEWLRFLLCHENFCNSAFLSAADHAFLSNLQDSVDATEVKKIESTTNHDLKAVEYYIKNKLETSNSALLKGAKELVHFGCTSEDINNCAYGLMTRDAIRQELVPRLRQVALKFAEMAEEFKSVPMLSLTHGQPATPTTFGKEVGLFGHRLNRQINRLQKVEIYGKFNGAVGNYNAVALSHPDLLWPVLCRKFVQTLGLSFQSYSTQIECHDYLAEMFDIVALSNTISIGACQDMWTYISRGRLRLKNFANEVGSSTMPHKVNPIDFENAEGNYGLANALFRHMSSKLPISRMQRDLSDSTVLRNIGTGFAYTTIAAMSLLKGLSKTDVDTKILADEIDNHWEVLAEPLQTILRREKVEGAYEILKDAVKGLSIKKVCGQMVQIVHYEFQDDFQIILKKVCVHVQDEACIQMLKSLTPQMYLGYAEEIASDLSKEILKDNSIFD